MFISELEIEKLKEKIKINQSNSERLILHEKNSQSIQIMCIAFKKNYKYPPIADKEKGDITFIVLEGKLMITTYNVSDNKKIDSQVICPKEIYKIPRSIYRETHSIGVNESIFMEIINGPYNRENRISMS